MNPTKPESFTDRMFDHARKVAAVGYSLQHLAGAFQDTGNKTVADNLADLADILQEEAETARRICSEKVAEDLAESEAQTRAVVGAVFAGLTSAKS